jgi:hypothetical protein
MDIENKELTVVRQQTTKIYNVANDLVIATDDDLTKATDALATVKNLGKMIKVRKEEITKPLSEALSSARDLFKPIETSHAEAERIIKGKMLAYQAQQEKARAEATAKIAAKVEAGTIKPETAIKKMEALVEVKTSSQGRVGAFATRIVRKYRITDASKLPRQFLMPDMSKITEALKSGVVVPGAEIYEEKVIASSS